MMDSIKEVLGGVTDLMERNNRGAQLGCYSVALVGLTVALRRVRPFSKFKRPSDIPNRFIQERRHLNGVVERIEPDGALLMIKHKPLVPIPGLPDGQLPVKISGVKISGLGLNWLQTIVAGSEVRFVPVSKNRDFLQCEVLLPQINNKKEHNLNVGESLVRIGFGHVLALDEATSSQKSNVQYFQQLQAAEKYALRQKLGYRYYIKPTKTILVAVVNALIHIIQTSIKQVTRVPKLSAS